MNTRFHPLANAFPLIQGEDFADLVEDIRKNGLQAPIVMYEGRILDGRNRWRACQELDVPHTERPYKGDDPAAYVWSSNAVRRQLTASQRAMAAAKLADLAKGSNQHVPVFRSEADTSPENGEAAQVRAPVTSMGDAAKVAKVGRRTVNEAKHVLDHGVPEVVEAVESGKLSVHAAQRVSQLPRAEQEQIMETVPTEEISRVVPTTRTARKLAAVPDSPASDDVLPRVVMSQQMAAKTAAQARARTKKWAENKEIIPDLDAEKLAAFLKDLRSERRAVDQLIKLIGIAQRPTGAE